MQHGQHKMAQSGESNRLTGLISVKIIAGLILLTGLATFSPHLGEYACLNQVYLKLARSVLLTPATGFSVPASCLGPVSWLLDGPRGGLRRMQMSILVGEPENSAHILDGLPVESAPVRLAYLIQGRAYMKNGDGEKAIQAWVQGGDLVDLILAGRSAMEAGNPGKALKFWEPAQKIWQKKGISTDGERKLAASALSSMAGISAGQGDHKNAAKITLEMAQFLDPPYRYEAFASAGFLYMHAGDLMEAKSWFEQARQGSPESAIPYIGLGRVAGEMDKWSESISYFQEAVRIDSQSGSSWYWLGKAYVKTGRISDGCQAFAQASLLEPSNASIQKDMDASGCNDKK